MTANSMKTQPTPADSQVREQALDPTRSFIVQAPAGSGKTELLTRRVLTLLTRVDEPEEVLAITFTRKAASEMRARVVETLLAAQSGEQPENDYQREGIALAEAVLERDAANDWQLLENTQRLNLRTIDALSSTFAHRLPIVSQLGGPAGLVEDARALYLQAAEQLLDHQAQQLDLLLLQLGNRQELVQAMLADLLANRDQWMSYVSSGRPEAEIRQLLESMLQNLIESRLEALVELLPASLIESLTQVLKLKADVHRTILEDKGESTADAEALACIADLPSDRIEHLPDWQAIANAVLTSITGKDSGLRKPRGLNRNIGFPTNAADAELVGFTEEQLRDRKNQMVKLLEQLGEDDRVAPLLDEIRQLPSGSYTDADWALLAQLLNMLPELITELHVVFAEHGNVDFVEMALRAQRALGAEDEPTDLALALDLKIKHILVDEFQDTSRTQFNLYKLLVAGWQPDDGRTFFAVGDPMQSIYRFREGDVTLFHQAQSEGVGSVQLDSLTLTVNFRAAPELVEWVNNTFAPLFPVEPDDVTGAVPYASSVAHLRSVGSVGLHAFVNPDELVEAETVAELAEQALLTAEAEQSESSNQVAILLRSRSQAAPVFKALQARGVAYQSIELELLGDRAVVKDLLSLCLAFRYPHDRLHWLAVLRAPWCGLTLSDLHAIVEDEPKATVFDLVRDPNRQARLSSDGLARVQRLLTVIEPAMQHVARGALVPWVESSWLQLGGPAICQNAIDMDAAERCLMELQQLEQDGRLWQASVLHQRMETLYASADTTARVHVMTLHKSKGLEFDTVILPSLDRKPRIDQQKILNWFESGRDANARLLLAPITERGLESKKADPINALVRRANQACDDQERLRLLYVACTRAKRHLHLLARIKTNVHGELAKPQSQSLLFPLWTFFESHAQQQLISNPSSAESENAESDSETATIASVSNTEMATDVQAGSAVDSTVPQLQRLTTNWQFPDMAQYEWPADTVRETVEVPDVEFSWAGTLARDVGTAVHALLQLLAHQNNDQREQTLSDLSGRAERQLLNLGMNADQLKEATAQVETAVTRTLSDEKGLWVLDSSHDGAKSEWALTAMVNGVVKKIVVDRTFVDEQGVRWIVDYKTGSHRGADLDAFLDREQERYSDQLTQYVDIISRMENRDVRAALYFPLLQGWREISLSNSKKLPNDGDESTTNAPAEKPSQQELF